MVGVAEPHDDRMRGEDERVELVGILAEQAGNSSAAGSALISLHDAAFGVGGGDHHAGIGRHQMVEGEDVHRACRAYQRNKRGVLSSPRHHAQARFARNAVPSPADPPNSGIGPRPAREHVGQMLLAQRQAVDEQESELPRHVRAAGRVAERDALWIAGRSRPVRPDAVEIGAMA